MKKRAFLGQLFANHIIFLYLCMAFRKSANWDNGNHGKTQEKHHEKPSNNVFYKPLKLKVNYGRKIPSGG